MNTQQTISEFKKYQQENAADMQLLIKSDNVAKQYYEGISEDTVVTGKAAAPQPDRLAQLYDKTT